MGGHSELVVGQKRRSPSNTVYGFDRISLAFDRPESPISEAVLWKHCSDLDVRIAQLPYQSRWKAQMAIYQPTADCLKLLHDSMRHDIAVLVTYVEFACDLLTTSSEYADRWRDEFVAAASVRYQQQPASWFKGTCYYGRRSDTASRRSNVVAVYSDRPSKLNNARPRKQAPPCLHIEWRVSGADALERHGVACLNDLILFDHQSFWNRNVRLHKLPKLTALGRLLATSAENQRSTRDDASRQRAVRWRAKHSVDKKFMMHNALLETRELTEKLEKVLFTDWLIATVAH